MQTVADTAFFARHAYPHDMKACKALAEAELWAKRHNVSFVWEIDQDSPRSDFEDVPEGEEDWYGWYVLAKHGQNTASLGGIHFKDYGEPWSDPYHRVVQAELALELQGEHESQTIAAFGNVVKG